MAKKWKAYREKNTGEILTGWVGIVDESWNHREWEEIDPPIFEDTITYESFSRGRSSATFNFVGKKQEYSTTMSGMEQMIPHMIKGVVTGKFTIRKQGSELSLWYLGDTEE